MDVGESVKSASSSYVAAIKVYYATNLVFVPETAKTVDAKLTQNWPSIAPLGAVQSKHDRRATSVGGHCTYRTCHSSVLQNWWCDRGDCCRFKSWFPSFASAGVGSRCPPRRSLATAPTPISSKRTSRSSAPSPPNSHQAAAPRSRSKLPSSPNFQPPGDFLRHSTLDPPPSPQLLSGQKLMANS